MDAAMPGKFFEDMAVGLVMRHPFGRTIIETDNMWFALLTCNPHQLHINAHYAAQQGLDRQPVVAALVLATVVGLSVVDVSLNATENVKWDEISFPEAVFVGDTLYAESEVITTRSLKEFTDRGEVTVQTTGLNQHGVIVLRVSRILLVKFRPDTP